MKTKLIANALAPTALVSIPANERAELTHSSIME